MKKNIIFVLLSLFIIIGLTFSAYLFLLAQKNKSLTPEKSSQTADKATEIPTQTEQITTADIDENSSIPQGWKTYKSIAYGFEISYPATYEALSDQNNLYGWPNAIVLLYKGGQSYDLPIEHWNSEEEYQTKYSGQTNYVVQKVNGKFITLFNTNLSPEVDEIIKTFREI